MGGLVPDISLALGLVISTVAVIRAVREGWHEWEPMRRALRRRAMMAEQASELEAAGEVEWARRRLHAGEMALARQLSRFELLREYPVWSFMSFVIPYLLVAGLPATILAAIGIRTDGWMWAAETWLVLQVILLVGLAVNMCIGGLWFDRKVRKHARTRLEAAGFRLDS